VHWVPGDPQTTHTINVLHLLLPAGEKWFVNVYRQAVPLITDEELREQVRGFMGQEATHSRAHALVLEHLAEQGVDTSRYTRLVDFGFERLLGDRPLGLRMPARFWLRRRLAIIAAIEHFTAVLGAWVLDASGLDDAAADPVMLDLLRWHGAEEVEHRAVAFDLFEHVSGSYLTRLVTMVGVFVAMVVAWVAGVIFFMHADPQRPGRTSYRNLRRAQKRGRLPSMKTLCGAVPRYLARSYHPSQEGDTERALQYLADSPAVA
jgi:predicted metal-dependent hydrolase